jgi:hypothetical protein
VELFFNTRVKPIESSSSAAPGPDHGSTNVVQAPGPNPAPSTANPGLSMEPSSPSSVQGAWGNAQPDQWWYKGDDGLHGPLYTPGLSEYGSDHELTGAHAPQPNPNPGPWANSYFDLNYWFPPPPRPASPKEFGQAHENQVEHAQQTNSEPSTDSDFDWKYWTNLEDPPPPRPSSPEELGQAHKNQVKHAQQTNPGPPSADSDFDWEYWTNLEDPPPSNPKLPIKLDLDRNLMATHQPPPYPLSSTEFPESVTHPPSPKEPDVEVVPGPPPSPGLTNPELHSDRQPVDLLAAIYAAKGKAKQSRRIFGAARDLGNAAQWELQPADC